MKIKSFYTTSPIFEGVLCDDQSFFVAVKDGEHFSTERTQTIVAKLCSMKRDESNSYNFFNKYVANENNLSECDYNIENFKRFIEIARERTLKGDTRPIYVFNFFERLDEATDIAPFVDLLAYLGRQVFIGVGNYPIERFEKYTKVQIV